MLKKDILATFGGQVGRAAMLILAMTILARVLGPSGRGLYALAMLLPRTVAVFAQFGQMAVNPTFAGLYREQRKALFAQSVLFAVVFGGLGLLGTAAYFFWLPLDLGKFSELPVAAIWIALLFIPAETLSGLLCELARGTERIVSTVVLMAASAAVMALGMLVVLVVFDGDVIDALWMTILAPAVLILGNLVQLRSIATVNPRQLSWPLMRESLQFGGVVTVSTAAMFLIGQIGLYLLGFMDVETAQIGLYATAVTMARQISFVPTSVAQAFLPRLSNNPEARAQQTPMVFRLTLLVCLAMMVLMALAGPPALLILFGFEFSGCIVPFLAMLPGLAVFGAFRVLGMYLWVKKKPQYGMVNNWICLVATTVLSLVLIPSWGIFGAAAGNTLGLTTLSVLTAWAYRRESGTPLRDLVPTRGDVATVVRETRALVGKLLRRKGPQDKKVA